MSAAAPQASAEPPAPSTDPTQLRTDLEAFLLGAFDVAEQLSTLVPSRSLSLVETKLEEAWHWLSNLGPDGADENPLRGGN